MQTSCKFSKSFPGRHSDRDSCPAPTAESAAQRGVSAGPAQLDAGVPTPADTADIDAALRKRLHSSALAPRFIEAAAAPSCPTIHPNGGMWTSIDGCIQTKHIATILIDRPRCCGAVCLAALSMEKAIILFLFKLPLTQ